MKITVEVLNAIVGPLQDVCLALLDGYAISELCPSEGWVETQQINPHLGRDQYRIEKYKHEPARLRSA